MVASIVNVKLVSITLNLIHFNFVSILMNVSMPMLIHVVSMTGMAVTTSVCSIACINTALIASFHYCWHQYSIVCIIAALTATLIAASMISQYYLYTNYALHRSTPQKVLIYIARILLVLTSVTATLDGKSSTKQWDLLLGPIVVKTLMNARIGVEK